ncbi:hypothetical protein PENSPDRAFT_123736 [Peniophora sp. CONT]|nr:hypothetical protein PENSPDRAFT_123736 [Peniophora sp. CONT]
MRRHCESAWDPPPTRMATSSDVSLQVELAYDILGEVSSLLGATPIPIINGVIRLLRVILEMREDVRHCKHEWHRVMLSVVQIQRVIVAHKESVEISGNAIPSYMKSDLRTLLNHLEEILETFTKYEMQGHLGRVFLRHQNRRDVKRCADNMWTTVTLFNMRISVEHANLIQSMQSQISTLTAQASMIQTMHSHISSTLSDQTAISASSLTSKPAVGKVDWSPSGRLLEDALEEESEVLSDDGDQDNAQNEEEDGPVLDWLGYLSFVDEI